MKIKKITTPDCAFFKSIAGAFFPPVNPAKMPSGLLESDICCKTSINKPLQILYIFQILTLSIKV